MTTQHRLQRKLKCYLSGPIEYAADHGAGWRKHVKQKFATHVDLEFYDPVEYSLPVLASFNIKSIEEFNSLKVGDPSERQLFREIMNTFIDLDIRELRTSDFVLAHISSHASGGTSGELSIARTLGIPVIAWTADDTESISGWVQACPDILELGPDALEKSILDVDTLSEKMMIAGSL